MPDGRLTDVHVHFAALPTPDNGVLLSKRLRESPVARMLGLPMHDPPRANALYLEGLRSRLAASKRVGRAVLLAMDGVYGADGRLDASRTDMLIPNDLTLAAAGGPFLAGVSINPARRDALEELARCEEAGAVLVKFLPNAQLFDPGDARYRPFYRALARLGLPLLCHTGHEFALKGSDQSAGDPARLALPLEEGVRVIAAHACSRGTFFAEPYLPTMLELARRFPLFYADLSALSHPNRVGMALRLRRHPELFGRLVFGTDYPLSVLWPGSNYFDRQAAFLEALGLPLKSFPL